MVADIVVPSRGEGVLDERVPEILRQPFRSVDIGRHSKTKIGTLLTDPTYSVAFSPSQVSGSIFAVSWTKESFLLVSLDKGRIGEGPAAHPWIISRPLTWRWQQSRKECYAGTPERRDLRSSLDGVPNVHRTTAVGIATMMPTSFRKYRAGMVLANQHLSQLDPDIRDAVFGNAGLPGTAIISFRVVAARQERSVSRTRVRADICQGGFYRPSLSTPSEPPPYRRRTLATIFSHHPTANRVIVVSLKVSLRQLSQRCFLTVCGRINAKDFTDHRRSGHPAIRTEGEQHDKRTWEDFQKKFPSR